MHVLHGETQSDMLRDVREVDKHKGNAHILNDETRTSSHFMKCALSSVKLYTHILSVEILCGTLRNTAVWPPLLFLPSGTHFRYNIRAT